MELALGLIIIGLTGLQAHAQVSDSIRVYEANPNYWQYKGEPIMLLGGSRADNLFQIPDIEEHLDLLAGVGGNVIRNTMSDRKEHDFAVYPHKQLDDGKYDLNQWNDEYWRRFEEMLRLTHDRDIIVQIEVWDRFDYCRKSWEIHPYNPDNNVTYTSDESGLANAYPDHAFRDRQPFFHTPPGMPLYEPRLDVVRAHQERFVAKMLSLSLEYPNVLYCMDNETTTPEAWGQHWMAFIQTKAAEKGVTVYTTDMFDDVWEPQRSALLRQAFDKPDIYPFIDVSQVNSRTFGEGHWTNVAWLVEQVKASPRPLNCTKIYSDGETDWGSGTPKDGVERFWRNIIAGFASCRFHRDGAGIGLNELAQSCIKAARKAETLVKFWDIDPHMELLTDRDQNEAYLAAKPGEAYLLFMTDGGEVTVDFGETPAKGRWIDTSTGEWSDDVTVTGSTSVAAPGPGPWVMVATSARE